ncbi:MAG TPA: hypothetical protein VGF97_11715 [Rhizomicrobium sp.]|jgi:hypothetical protein
MKTLLAWGAAALIASGTGAWAKGQTHIITLNGHCDEITLIVNKTLVAGSDDASCEAGFGGGLIGNVKKFGNAIVAGVQFTSEPGNQLVFQISYPLATGGNWILYDTTDGVTLNQLESGTYTVQKEAGHAAHGAAPITAGLHR